VVPLLVFPPGRPGSEAEASKSSNLSDRADSTEGCLALVESETPGRGSFVQGAGPGTSARHPALRAGAMPGALTPAHPHGGAGRIGRARSPSVTATARQSRSACERLTRPAHGPLADWRTGRQSCGSRAVSHIARHGSRVVPYRGTSLTWSRGWRPGRPGLGPSAQYPGRDERSASERAFDRECHGTRR